jgi:hypothetical protein
MTASWVESYENRHQQKEENALKNPPLIYVEIHPGHGKSVIIQLIANILCEQAIIGIIKPATQVIIVCANEYLAYQFSYTYKNDNCFSILYMSKEEFYKRRADPDTFVIIDEVDDILGPNSIVSYYKQNNFMFFDFFRTLEKYKGVIAFTGTLSRSTRAQASAAKKDVMVVEVLNIRSISSQENSVD